MNRDDSQILATLARLDPAAQDGTGGPASLTTSEARRAATALDQILAVDPQAQGPRLRTGPGLTRRRRPRRFVLAPLVALVSAAAVIGGVLTAGGDKAYASWSPLPVALSATESAAAVRACLNSLHQGADPTVAPVLAERRGGWTYVLIRPAQNVQSSCIMPTEEISRGATADHRRWFGSTDEEISEPAPGATKVRVDTAATGTTEEGLFRYSEGAVGSDVVGLTFTTPRGVTVQASVAHGRYAVWWPAGDDSLRSPEISEAPDIDVSLADGSTYRLPR